MSFEQACGAGEAFVGRKKSLGRNGRRRAGSGAAVCGFVLCVGGGGIDALVVAGRRDECGEQVEKTEFIHNILQNS